MPSTSFSRRDLLEKCLGVGVVTAAASLLPDELAWAWAEAETARRATAEAALGPFYKKRAPATSMLRAAGGVGLPLSVSGRVFDTRGNRLTDAVVEVWQADHLGHYDLDGYRYRARLALAADGAYTFQSVMPGHYPDRVCQHIHYLVTAPGHRALPTQLYFASDPVFEGDPDKTFNRDPLITSRELVRPVVLLGDPKEMRAEVTFDIVLETL